MRALLVHPEFPATYWSLEHVLPFVGRKCLLPPLGLLTVAALLPRDWEVELVDTAVEPLTDRHLRECDVVLLTGMLVQKEAMHEVVERCRSRGVRVVVGGPCVTARPDEFEGADHVVIGEGERTIPRLAADLAAGAAERVYEEKEKPSLEESPVPRYDLLKPNTYHHMSLQYSRGCPFTCEFCDIIVMYGRKPRSKTPEQVIRELDAIEETGFRGDVFFVDDNFIGNKPTVKRLLPTISEWRRRTGGRLSFFTEASVNLADDPALMTALVDAGFRAVFIGIESPSVESLKETRKTQNVTSDQAQRIRVIFEHGLDIWGGFILGFDSDGADIFDQMIDFVQRCGIPYAMVGLLTALPNTPLYERLKAEGRLREEEVVEGNQFGLTNVETRLPLREMVGGYRRVLATLYDPAGYFERCKENLGRRAPVPTRVREMPMRRFAAAFRSLVAQGVMSPYRGEYWKFLAWTLRNGPSKTGRAIALASVGHHFITYTRDHVLPHLDRQLAALEREARDSRAPSPAATAAMSQSR